MTETLTMSPEETLTALYGEAPPDVLRRGRAWYPTCMRQLREIAQGADARPCHAAAVFAIVSPAAQLSMAMRWTGEILRGERIGGRYPTDQGPKIAAALATSQPGRVLTGPKVSAFYRALMGDPDALVIDRWAAFATGLWDRAKSIPAAVWRRIEDAYRTAAAESGESVRAFQAVTWIAVRESTPLPKRGGIVPRLWDVGT